MKSLFKKGLFALALLGSLSFAWAIPSAYAQDVTENLETVGEESGLGNEDLRITIANIIRTGLSILGVVALCIVLYGGFVWMTASGDPEKVDRAKRILINGGIGLVIILMSWSITTFIISSILGATSGSGGSGGSGGGSGGSGSGSGGSSSAFEVTGISPEGTQTIRNIQVQITFSHTVQDESVTEDVITVTNSETNEEVAGILSVSGKRVTFVPSAACPTPNEDRFCFDENTSFTVSISEDIENTSGVALTCSSETCTGSFTSGTIVDTEDPVANMTDPDDRDAIAADSTEGVETEAADDAGVAAADFSLDGAEPFESVTASGDDLTRVVMEAMWDTAGLTVGETYEVQVTVTDVAGNTDKDAVTVTARPATCFNGIQDEDMGETDVDCGGESDDPNYCGACEGSSCSEDTDCGGSLSCEDSVCSDSPVIADVSPDNGAEGTYVTVSGSGFGDDEGVVYFSTDDGEAIAASLASCADGWSDEEIIVVVPEGAGDGPLSVVTSGGDEDATDDEAGELVPDFDVNETQRPALCSVTPESGLVADAFVLSGKSFGASRGTSTVIFGDDEEAGSYTSWSDESITATVPSLEEGDYSIVVIVDEIESNVVTFEITEEDEGSGPVIVSLDPSTGGVGQYVTITGTDFGSLTGSVWFENAETGEKTLGDIEFPDECSDDVWSDTEVTVMVPDVDTGSYSVTVETRSGESSAIAFTVTGDDPTPGLCALSPDSGDTDDAVIAYGDNFGSDEGTITLEGGVVATVTSWADGDVAFMVPAGAETGSLTVTNSSSEESNGLTFTVSSDTDDEDSSAISAAYAWSFSSGEIPEVPEVLIECTDTSISAVPNDLFTEESCVDAEVYVEFTVDMNEATLDDALTVEECTAEGDDPCDTTEAVSGTFATTETSATFSPNENFSVSTTYLVTVSTAAMSADATALAEEVSWTFTTKADDSACEVESVIVSPDAETLTAINDTQGFSALPIADCNVLDADDFVWSWEIDESYASFSSSDSDCAGGSSSCATAEALAEGTTLVSATESESEEQGDAALTINFSDPYITQYFPDCTEACTNATVGARFNVAMDATSVTTGTNFYLCSNELCTSLTEISGVSTACISDEDGSCMGFTLTLPSTLTSLEYYRVVASGDMESTSGVPLTRTNYGDDFSWTFRVREDGTVCAVERVAMSPSSAQSSEIGDQKVFTAEAYGEADSCSVSGQLLDAYSYSWSWADPIEDENNDGDTTTIVAEWTDASLADSDPDSIPEGCTSACTAAGSEPHAAVCGDGALETDEGEECEDGNVTNGDGCSSSCLHEGSDAVGYVCSGADEAATCSSLSDDMSCMGETYPSATCEATASGCGDGSIDSDTEDCDDGNSADGDGCSAECLAEGSASIGATCGNSDIAYVEITYAGEECDDGNASNGDGCSSSCTNEGSPTLASIGGAICGDSAVDDPYETCDDGNTDDDDGCSSQCLYEGSSLSYAVPSACNDGSVGTGEECEDGNLANGDGCSADCLLEGSSAAYDTPSYCGDGTVGAGEVSACEVGAGGDGRVDPVQVANIADSAVFEVSSDTNQAIATVEATESSSTYTASAEWTLFCAATSDSDCTNPDTQGVGTGNCCMDRPTATITPADGTSDVCRNAAMYATFTEPMDTSTFTYENDDSETSYRMYATLDVSSSGGSCPDTHTTLVQAPHGFFARAWYTMKRWIFGEHAKATVGDCIVPIESFSQEEVSGTYVVQMNASELLYAGGEYTLTIEGDGTTTDATVEGVRSRYGVGMNGNTTSVFTAGSEVCAADAVEVEDTDEENPGTFTSLDDSHTYFATAISYNSGTPQEIAEIAGIYDWTWSSWESDDTAIINAVQDGTDADTATVTPAGQNGTANVAATLTIQNNTAGIETESSVSGSEEAIAFLCENPWPAIDSYPWIDDATGTAVGAEEGIGWTNFSFGYCKDTTTAGVESTYPELTVISPDDPGDDVILKEYIFQVQGTNDAIGIRIAANPEYLSPKAWYEAQGFEGSVTETTIDGFPAVEDGRTTYVAAPNLDSSGTYLYSNMYIISRNDNAEDDTEAIYEQIIDNFAFATNIGSVGYCSSGSSYTTECSSDLDCDVLGGESCADVKAKVARDTQRLADMTDLRTQIEAYGENNGYCSATTDQICSTDSDCPSDESCVAAVPTLPSGTFVRSFASSVWGSWSDILGGALENEPTADPLNAYQGCGVRACSGSPTLCTEDADCPSGETCTEGDYADYDAETCVNETTGSYVCPEGSAAYHYRAYGNHYAYISADLEYAAPSWYYPIDDVTTDDVEITIGNSSGYADGFATAAFCDGATTYGSSATCGDGVVGSGEACEVGESGGTSATCDSDSDGVDDGYISQICNSTCSAYEDNASATCTPASCGNGIVESPETCDDGSANGRYGYCGSLCTYESGTYCGDGELSGGELCDCGDADILSSIPANARAYGTSSGGTCTEFNGEYAESPNVSCAWDCSGAASYCGDGEISGSEECDGSDDTWDGELCYGGTDDGDPCTSSSDCSSGVCGGSGVYAACETGSTRVLSCDDDAGASCTYSGSWDSVSCTEIGSCGDGTVDPDEECDDGNDDGTDSCTSECTANVCGDGYLYSGEEECDEGTANGEGCDAAYGSTCSACTTSCRTTVSSGAFCGDGTVNGSEFCDGSDIPYQYFDTSTGTSLISSACTAGDPVLVDGSITYSCRRVGYCDGGSENGEYCTSSTGGTSGSDYQVCDANGATAVSCVFPTCADACTSSCPFTQVSTSLLLTANLPGSADSSSVDLYSYSSESTADLPNAATIIMPACNVAGTLTGTIDMTNVDLPDVYVAFVTDRSGSMSASLGSGTRMSVARGLLETSITELFAGLGEDMHISLVGYSNQSGTGICSSSAAYSCDSDNGSGDSAGACSSSGATCDDRLLDTFSSDYGFAALSNEATLQSRVDEFTEGGSTYTVYAFEDAKEMLDDIPETGNVRKIVVLLSDGSPSDSSSHSGSGYEENVNITDDIKDAGYEIYTVALTTSSTLISDMNDWSSNSGESVNDNGIDYAYDGDTVTELEAAYESIIDSILGVTVGVVSTDEDAGVSELTTDIVGEGNNVSLPWPENFTCDPESEQEVPIQLTFLGEGTIELSNLRIEYCAP